MVTIVRGLSLLCLTAWRIYLFAKVKVIVEVRNTYV